MPTKTRTKKSPPQKAKAVPQAKFYQNKIERWYRTIVITFIAITVLMLGIIVYFSFSKTTITVTTNPTPITVSYKVQVVPSGTDAKPSDEIQAVLPGTTVEVVSTKEQSFTYGQEVGNIPAKAHGSVTLTNTTSKSQPLIERTRLLSKSGILFRTTKTVTVPAGGTMVVDVEADQAGDTGNIAPDTFTIVALWPGLQDKIFGTSTDAMTGGVVTSNIVRKEDIDKARTELLATIADEAIQSSAEQKGTYDTTVSSQTLLDESSDVLPNTEATSFTLHLHTRTRLSFLNAADLHQVSLTQLSRLVGSGETLNSSTITQQTQVSSYDDTTHIAVLSVDSLGDTTLTATNSLLSPTRFVNLSESAIRSLLMDNAKVIASVHVRFSPFWLQRAPAIADHIHVEVQPH